MDPENLGRLERLTDMVSALVDAVARLETKLASWEQVFGDPGTFKARLAKRKLGKAAADMLAEGDHRG